MRGKILVIEDDVEFLNLTQTWLQNAGYEVLTSQDGAEGLRRVYSSRPNLVLLDANIPKMDGWEVCRRIRDMSDIPVLMVTVNGQKADRLKGFVLGADDYITKPVDFPELIARVQAVLRRSDSATPDDGPSTFHNGEIEVEWRSRQVWVRGERVKLKAKLTTDIHPKIVHAAYGWWFPEKPSPEHGCFDSNINVVLTGDPPREPICGSVRTRGTLCRIYKV